MALMQEVSKTFKLKELMTNSLLPALMISQFISGDIMVIDGHSLTSMLPNVSIKLLLSRESNAIDRQESSSSLLFAFTQSPIIL